MEAFVPDPARYDRASGPPPAFSATTGSSRKHTPRRSGAAGPLGPRPSFSPQRDEALPRRTPLRLALELDLMARLAGLRLEHRWAGWRREEFTESIAPGHISVYRREWSAYHAGGAGLLGGDGSACLAAAQAKRQRRQRWKR